MGTGCKNGALRSKTLLELHNTSKNVFKTSVLESSCVPHCIIKFKHQATDYWWEVSYKDDVEEIMRLCDCKSTFSHQCVILKLLISKYFRIGEWSKHKTNLTTLS